VIAELENVLARPRWKRPHLLHQVFGLAVHSQKMNQDLDFRRPFARAKNSGTSA
jgi:hypothetical protein